MAFATRFVPLVVAAGCGFQTTGITGDAAPHTDADPDARAIDARPITDGPFDPGAPIAGGGVGGGPLHGDLAVYVIDAIASTPIAGATVEVGATRQTTDATGLATFTGLTGAKQTVGALLGGYRSELWVGVTGAHVTLPLLANNATVPTGTLTATSGDLTLPKPMPGHARTMHALAVSERPDFLLSGVLGLIPGTQAPQCNGAKTCDVTATTRTGTLAVAEDVIDNGNAFANYHFARGVAVAANATTTVTLTAYDQTKLVDAVVTYQNIPDGLTAQITFTGLGLPGEGSLLYGSPSSTLSPAKLPALADTFADASYQIYAAAYIPNTATTSQLLVTQTTPTFQVRTWLSPATTFTPAADHLTYTTVTGAQLVTMRATGLEVVILDGTTTVAFPSDIAAAGTATLYAARAAPAIDPANFGFAADGAKLDAVSTIAAKIN